LEQEREGLRSGAQRWELLLLLLPLATAIQVGSLARRLADWFQCKQKTPKPTPRPRADLSFIKCVSCLSNFQAAHPFYRREESAVIRGQSIRYKRTKHSQRHRRILSYRRFFR